MSSPHDFGEVLNPLASAAVGNDGRWNSRFPDHLKMAVSNPETALLELDRFECERSRGGLLSFTKFVWPILEPGRKLILGWVLDAICEHLEAVTRGEIRKLLINVPPGFMKSMLTSVIWPAWEWGPMNLPQMRYFCASYAESLTLRDNRKCRQIIADVRYKTLWGDRVQIVSDQDAKGKFENTMRGWKLASSIGGSTTGERGDRLVLDDPHNIREVESQAKRDAVLHWFTEVLPSRVNDPDKTAFVCVMQRTHELDVSGHILESMPGWEHLCLPMEYDSEHPHSSKTSIGFVDPRKSDGELLWPERFSRRYLEEELKPSLRSWGGTYAESGQLQQRPTARGGGMFKRSWWRFFQTTYPVIKMRPSGCSMAPPIVLPQRLDTIIISVDAAFKDFKTGSRVSIIVMGAFGPYRAILDNMTDHRTFSQTCDLIAKVDKYGNVIGGLLAKYPGRKVIIEDKANGPAIIDTMQKKVSGLVPVNPRGGKISRATSMQPLIESGHLLLPDGAPWVPNYVSEHASFPTGRFNDQVDATSQAVIQLMGSNAAARAALLLG